jgi:hypothetical protein
MRGKALRNRQFGTAATTLLVAYLLVLQGFAVSFAAQAKGVANASYGSSICLGAESGGNIGVPTAPTRRMSHGDACCVFHCDGFGAPAAFLADEPLLVVHSGAQPAVALADHFAPRLTFPLGSRAPPELLI